MYKDLIIHIKFNKDLNKNEAKETMSYRRYNIRFYKHVVSFFGSIKLQLALLQKLCVS